MRPDPQRLIDRREFPVLYVDDESENLRAFELAFRREYEIYTAESGSEALDLINRLPIAVVLSDHRMPGMTGTEFLSRVRTVDPRIVRLLVTAYGDAETLADAVNNGNIYRYIAKPWGLEEMRLAVSQAIDLYALESEREGLLAELTALRSVSHELAKEREPGRLASLVVRTVVDELGFDAATLLLRNGKSEFLTVADCSPNEGRGLEKLKSFNLSIGGNSLWTRGIASGKTQLLVADHAVDYGVEARALMTEIAAEEILSVPLIASGGLVGVLLVDNRRGGRPFLASGRALLEGLSSQVALAIQNAEAVRGGELAAERDRMVERLAAVAGPALLLQCGKEHQALLAKAVERLLDAPLARSGSPIDLRASVDKGVSLLSSEENDLRRAIRIDLPAGMKVCADEDCLAVSIALILAEAVELCGGVDVVLLDSPRLGTVRTLIPRSCSADSVKTSRDEEVGAAPRIVAAALMLQLLGGTLAVSQDNAWPGLTIGVTFLVES